MQFQIQKWGNSLALRIPKSFAVEAKVKEGTTVDISIQKGKLVVNPINKQKYFLDELLAKVNDKNMVTTQVDRLKVEGY